MLEEPRIDVLPPAFDGIENGSAKGGAKKTAAKGKKGKAAAERRAGGDAGRRRGAARRVRGRRRRQAGPVLLHARHPLAVAARAADASLAHLLGRLGIVEARVRAAVSARRAADPNPDDPFRGLYLSEDHVERLLSPGRGRRRRDAGAASRDRARRRQGGEARTRTCACAGSPRTFSLEPLDIELLLVALAPDLDARFERLYGYLHDDVTRRRASIGLALELAGALPAVAGRPAPADAGLAAPRGRPRDRRGAGAPVPDALAARARPGRDAPARRRPHRRCARRSRR